MMTHDTFDVARAVFQSVNQGGVFRVRPNRIPGGAELAPALAVAFGVKVGDLACREYLLAQVSWNWEVRVEGGWRDLVRTEAERNVFLACLKAVQSVREAA